MADELQGKTVAILATDGVERVEFETPKEAAEKAGARVEVLSLETGEIQAMDSDINPSAKAESLTDNPHDYIFQLSSTTDVDGGRGTARTQQRERMHRGGNRRER